MPEAGFEGAITSSWAKMEPGKNNEGGRKIMPYGQPPSRLTRIIAAPKIEMLL